MNREELLKQRDKLQKELDKLTELINKKDIRFKPEYGEYYYYLGSNGNIIKTDWANLTSDWFRYNSGNCFKTEDEGRDYKENLITKQQLKDLALELDNGAEVGWSYKDNRKYTIYFSHDSNKLVYDWNWVYRAVGGVHCTNEKFYEVAIERIGEEKLIKLIKSGV